MFLKGLLFIPMKRNPNVWSNFIIKCQIELTLGQRNFQHLKFWISNFRNLLVLNILMTYGINNSRFKKFLFGDDHDMLEELEKLFKYKIARLMVKFVVV